MAVFNQRNPVIRTTTITPRSGDVVLTTNPIINIVGDRFILEIDQSIPFGSTLPITLNDTTDTYVIFDRYGNFVRADRLYSAVQFREMGLLPFNGCNVRQFQCVLGTDPGRINILCCLPRSSANMAGTTTEMNISDTNNTTTSMAETIPTVSSTN